MINLRASCPAIVVSPNPGSSVRPRVFFASVLALGLHGALLVPGLPTLVSSVGSDASPVMTVRFVPRKSAPLSAPAVEPTETAGRAAAPTTASSDRAGPTMAAAPGVDAVFRAQVTSGAAPAPSFTLPSPAAQVAASPSIPPAPAVPIMTMPQPGLPSAPAYLVAGRLDPGPRPLEDIDPRYPEEAKQQEGSVVLRLLINEEGTIDNVAVVQAYPAGLFESSALDAFGKARFSPGRLLGIAVKSQITIEVMFTPINRGKVSGRSY